MRAYPNHTPEDASVHRFVHALVEALPLPSATDETEPVVLTAALFQGKLPTWNHCGHWFVHEWIYFLLGREEFSHSDTLVVIQQMFTGTGRTRLPPQLDRGYAGSAESNLWTSVDRTHPEVQDNGETFAGGPWSITMEEYPQGWDAIDTVVRVAEELCYYSTRGSAPRPTQRTRNPSRKTFRGDILLQTLQIHGIAPSQQPTHHHLRFPMLFHTTHTRPKLNVPGYRFFPCVGPAIDDAPSLDIHRPLANSRPGLVATALTIPIRKIQPRTTQERPAEERPAEERSLDERLDLLFPENERTLETLFRNSPSAESMVLAEVRDLQRPA